jgi:hypothetical protein
MYVNTLKLLLAYCEREHLRHIADLAVEDLDGCRSTRTLAPSTSAKELEILRPTELNGQSENNPMSRVVGRNPGTA